MQIFLWNLSANILKQIFLLNKERMLPISYFLTWRTTFFLKNRISVSCENFQNSLSSIHLSTPFIPKYVSYQFLLKTPFPHFHIKQLSIHFLPLFFHWEKIDKYLKFESKIKNLNLSLMTVSLPKSFHFFPSFVNF